MAVQVKVFSEKFQAGLFSKVYLTEHLKVAYVRHGVVSDVLRMEVEKAQNISEELRVGGRKAPDHVISEDNNFPFFRLRFLFCRFRGAVRHDILFGQIAGFHKIFKCVLRDDGANPITGSGCFGRHYEEGSLKKIAGSNLSRRESITTHIQNGGLQRGLMVYD